MATRVIRLRMDRITRERIDSTPHFFVTIIPRPMEAAKKLIAIRTNVSIKTTLPQRI
jgi:hypothetical protein